MIDLDLGIPVIASEYAPVGSVIYGVDPVPGGGSLVAMHPLDLIAIRHGDNALDHLDAAMAWIVARAHRKLDALSREIAH